MAKILSENRQSSALWNVIYIHTHDTGRYIEPYTAGVNTPALSGLARNGTTLRNLFCAGPTCSPSRSALLTGMMPHCNGMLGLAHRGFSLNDISHHLCRYLQKNGYKTALFGMQHEVAAPKMLGYDHLDICASPEAEDLTAWDNYHAGAVCTFLENDFHQPFFLSFGLVHTHRPFLETDPDINPDFVQVPESMPNVEAVRQDTSAFLTSIRRADAAIGQVLQKICQLGLEKNTVILYTTDHGAAFPFMKCNLFDSGIGVAGIISFPGNRQAGKSIDAMLSQLDIYPTLCDILKIPHPEWLQGISFYNLLTAPNNSREIHESIFAEVTYHAAYEPQRCIRTPRYKLIRRYADLRPESQQYGFPAGKPRLANIDQGPSREYLMTNNLDDYAFPEIMLFDLIYDPHERNNLAYDHRYLKIRQDLETKLEKHQKETGDELLTKGYIIAPEGAVVNRQTCINPDSNSPDDYE